MVGRVGSVGLEQRIGLFCILGYFHSKIEVFCEFCENERSGDKTCSLVGRWDLWDLQFKFQRNQWRIEGENTKLVLKIPVQEMSIL